jgi:hypothetical protein
MLAASDIIFLFPVPIFLETCCEDLEGKMFLSFATVPLIFENDLPAQAYSGLSNIQDDLHLAFYS